MANSYAALTYKQVGSGSFVAGIAYLGKVCASKRERVNINLYYSDASEVAEVRKGSITFFKSEFKFPSCPMICRLLLTR